jgi:holo-[acyl-carrier protein] synthase
MSGNLRVGIDLVQISRIAASREQFGERFLQRIFTAGEIAYALSSQPHTDARLAARFAAKEAVMKALGVGLGAFQFHDVEVVNAPSGKPSLVLRGKAAQLADAQGVEGWQLSLTHTDRTAHAVAVAL